MGEGGPPGMGFRGGPPGVEGDRGESRGSRRGSSEDRRSRFEGFLRSMDTNQNGTIEPNEVPEERRGMLQAIAGRMGLDASKPISLDQIREAMSRRSRGEGGPPPEGSQPSSDKPSDKKSAKEPEPLVPGFGVEQELASVPEFGVRVEYPGLAAAGSSKSGSSGSSSSRGDRDSRVRFFAQMMFRRADRNHNGTLEKDEWEGVRDAEAADRNHDGVITLDEMTERLTEYSRRRDEGSHGDSAESSSQSDSPRDDKSNGRKSYRFLTPTERLPGGLPDWFARDDADGDGQVAMAEYSTLWSDAKVREFAAFDLNGDGVITPRECLDAATRKDASASPPGGAPGGPPGGPPAGPPGASPGGPPSPPPGPPSGQGESKPWWLQ
jgi:Ca2+-binding EF-hand superfamily protein